MKKCLCVILILMLCIPTVQASDQPKYIALTFDDGPTWGITQELLEGLAERGVHATFFLCGYRVEQFPKLTARIAQEGHEIGVHGDKHKLFSKMSTLEVCADLSAAMERLEAATGKRPTLLRPPGGCYDLDVLRQTGCSDLPVILWSVDVQDWNQSSSANIARGIEKQAKSGDIVLLHDTKASSVKAALKIIDDLETRGFEFVTVSELACLSCTELKPMTSYRRFSFTKKASISSREALTEPWAKVGFPPPRPWSSAFRDFIAERKSPSKIPRA